jgi:dTDP-glucose 4,6-dehydratase
MKRGLESLEDHTTFQESKDRPGHDWRQAIDGSKSERELGWRPQEVIGTGLRRTVDWYLKNRDWIRSVQDDGHKAWMQAN